MWYLIVSIPDLCHLSYFVTFLQSVFNKVGGHQIFKLPRLLFLFGSSEINTCFCVTYVLHLKTFYG